jgi:hypothetical protein
MTMIWSSLSSCKKPLPIRQESGVVDDVKTSMSTTFDLSVKNPDGGGEVVVHRSPEDIMDEIAALDAESAEVLASIRGLL